MPNGHFVVRASKQTSALGTVLFKQKNQILMKNSISFSTFNFFLNIKNAALTHKLSNGHIGNQ